MRENKPVEIGQKALSILVELARANGQPVSKALLFESCWPNQIVEDGNLTVQIAALRKLLGQTDDGLDWIVTVPRVGYRLIKRDAPKEVRIISPRRQTIAVLPFANLSAEPANGYFATGLAAEITSALARYKSLTVLSGTEDLANTDNRQRAASLGVNYLVEGSVMRSGEKLRIVVSLIDGVTGAVSWNQRFDADMADVFEVQDMIAATVASHVEPAISSREIEAARRKSLLNMSAYDLYLRAQQLELEGTPETMAEAFRLLQQALALDPDNARATGLMCELMIASVAAGMPSLSGDDRTLGEHCARRCIELADCDARDMARAASALLHITRDLPGTLAIAERAYKLNPNDWEVANVAATVQLHGGDLDVAFERYSRAVQLGPTHAVQRFSLTGLAHLMILRGQYDKAIAYASEALAVSSGFSITFWMLIAANAHLGRMDVAHHWLGVLQEKWPGVNLAMIREGQPRFMLERIEPVLAGLRLAEMKKK